MSKTTETVFQAAMALPDADRVELVARLVESLEPRRDPEVEAAWRAEIGRRLRSIDEGDAEFTTWPEVRDRLRSRLDGGA